MTQIFTQIVLVCGVEGCEHGPIPQAKGISEIAHPEKLDEVDLNLLNKLTEEDPDTWDVTPREIVEGHLNGRLKCPTHGRQHLGYQSTAKFTASLEFVIDLEEKDGPPGVTSAPDLFDDDPPDWETS